MKKFLIAFFIVTFCLGVLISTFMILNHLDVQASLSGLEKYNINDKDIEVLSEFKIRRNKYIILKENSDKFRLLVQYKKELFLLDSRNNCITYNDSILVHNDDIFVHCTGFKEVDKYTLNNFESVHQSVKFNFDKTPNFSPLHMKIDAIDEKYIYFSSLKLDGKIKEGEKARCTLDKKFCEYYE